MSLKRSRAAALGRETVEILRAGRYLGPGGSLVDIREALRRAVDGTCSYPPERTVADALPGSLATQIEVANESTLTAARRLLEAGHRPAALNFASARHPGGGFLSGARAQEESLARASGLYACLEGNPMYDLHDALRDPMYTDYVIYSPNVPVLRGDDEVLLDQPFLCSFLTSPAVNARVVLERDRARGPAIREAMWRRTLRVLGVAAAQGHDALVLGAWGCGVFGNDGHEIAGSFHRALQERFRGTFRRVRFAVLDDSEEGRYIGPFRSTFGACPKPTDCGPWA